RERDALERARRRFIRTPTEKRLHDVRTAGRRFRSLLEDVADLVPARKLLGRVKRAAAATDAARDASIALRLLDAAVDEGERQNASWLFAQLRQREAEATQCAHRRLRHARFVR
ncbi:MAG: CHAD domain-containing protein, partial [Candidatus Cybelea sp.]